MAFEWSAELPDLSPVSMSLPAKGINQESVYLEAGEIMVRTGLRRHHVELAESWGSSIEDQGYIRKARMIVLRAQPIRKAA